LGFGNFKNQRFNNFKGVKIFYKKIKITIKILEKLDKTLYNSLIKVKKLFFIFSLLFYPLILLIITFIYEEKDKFLKGLGSLAFYLLITIITIKPVIEILNLKKLRKYLVFRRELGIITFYTALFHGFYLYSISGYNLNITYSLILSNSGLIFGFLALIILFVLFLTSNDYSVKLLKKNWKRIQRLVYLVPFLILLHLIFLDIKEIYKYLVLVLVYYLLKLLEILNIKINLKKFFTKKSNES